MEKESKIFTLDDNSKLYCKDCKKHVFPNNLCEHFEICTNIPNDNNSDNGHVDTTSLKTLLNDDLDKDHLEMSLSSETFEEILISAVQEQPLLWDPTIKIQLRTKTAKDESWKKIFNLFDGKHSIEFLQKKWKNLRDTYMRTKSDVEEYVPSGSGTKKKKKVWKYYDCMCFLSDHENKTNRFSNVSQQQENGDSSSEKLTQTPTGRVTKRDFRGDPIGEAILEAIQKDPPAAIPVPTGQEINPICLRISQILEKLPEEEKTRVELELLRKAYELVFK